MNEVEDILPPIKKYRVLNTANLYGSFHVVERCYGIRVNPLASISWQHGWRINSLNGDISSIISPSEWHYDTHFVTNQRQADLIGESISHVIAVGLPYAHVLRDKSTAITRRKGSLLVMPPHGINQDFSFTSDYFYQLKPHLKQFSYVCVCINDVDFNKGEMIRVCRELGLDYVRGAVSNDKNALYRMKGLFDYFEFMTTPVVGSHIAYAAATGVKVSIFLHQENCYKLDHYVKHPWFWHALWHKNQIDNIGAYSHQKCQKVWPWLYVEPKLATQRIAWGLEQIGYEAVFNKTEFINAFIITPKTLISGGGSFIRKIKQKGLLWLINSNLKLLGFVNKEKDKG